MLAVFRGVVEMSNFTQQPCNTDDVDYTASMCDLEMRGLNEYFCLKCKTGNEMYADYTYKTLQCATTGTVPAHLHSRSSTGPLSILKANCPITKYHNAFDTCSTCGSGCKTCSTGPGLPVECTGCDYASREYVAGGACVVCPTGHIYDPVKNSCLDPAIAANCSHENCAAGCDEFGKCSACDADHTWKLGYCHPDIPNGKVVTYRTGYPELKDCHGDCLECFDEYEYTCTSCAVDKFYSAF